MTTSPNPNRFHPLRLAMLAAMACTAGNVMATDAPAVAAVASFPATPPAPGPAPTLQLPTPAVHTLANGLQVISVRRAGLPLVTAQVTIRSGGEMDPPQLAGLADLTATLLTRGAGGRSAPRIAEAAETLGGSLLADAGWDQSAVSMTVTTPRLPQALALLASVVRQPDFSAAELKRAQTQAIDDVRLELSQPSTLAELAVARSVFGAGAYGHARSGTPASIARIRRADVQHLHAALYRPDNALLILTGDVTPEQAQALAQASFGDWQKPAAALPARPTGRAASSVPAVLMVDQHGAGQAGVVAAHVAPARSDADYYAGAVANAVLGGSYSARLNEEIRIKRGLSYGARSELELRRDSGLWLASAQTKNPSAAQVVQLMLGQFQRLGSTPVEPAELAARKATMIGAYGRSLETTAGLAARIGALAVYGLPLEDIGRYVQRVQDVTPAQVAAYASAHLTAKDSKVVVVGDAGQFGTAVRATHPQAQLLQATALDLDSASLQKPHRPK
jgi:zinc protease